MDIIIIPLLYAMPSFANEVPVVSAGSAALICVSTHQKVWTMELEQQRALRQLEELAAEVGLTSRLASIELQTNLRKV